MALFMGIDLGTSSVKALLVDESGERLALAGESYGIAIPRPKWAEQDPREWWEKSVRVVGNVVARAGRDPGEIAAIGFSGQMHGLVAVDAAGEPVRQAIIWPDQRTAAVIDDIHRLVGREFIAEQTQNALAAGFLVASLYWLREREPDVYARIDKVMLPKDYLKFRLAGVVATDPSDAAGTLAFDNIALRWADALLRRLGIDPGIFPDILPSTAVVGRVTRAAAGETGLSPATLIVNGGADQAMQAIGNGIVRDGVFSANIGTGGQVSTSTAVPVFDPERRTSTFAHALPGRWYIMGGLLASGLSLDWLAKNVLGGAGFAELTEWASEIPPGSGGLFFLPYLSGERTPHLDPAARAVFFGLTLGHDRRHLARAVMEGVVYSFCDCFDILAGLGLECEALVASGGGAVSEVWLQMQADMFGLEVRRSLGREQACLGAAITACVGAGASPSFAEACAALVRFEERVYLPDERNARVYGPGREVYRELYRNNRETFKRLDLFAEPGAMGR